MGFSRKRSMAFLWFALLCVSGSVALAQVVWNDYTIGAKGDVTQIRDAMREGVAGARDAEGATLKYDPSETNFTHIDVIFSAKEIVRVRLITLKAPGEYAIQAEQRKAKNLKDDHRPLLLEAIRMELDNQKLTTTTKEEAAKWHR